MADAPVINSIDDIRQAWGPAWANASDEQIICAYSASSGMPVAEVANRLGVRSVMQCPTQATQQASVPPVQETPDAVYVWNALSIALAVAFVLAALHHHQHRRVTWDAAAQPLLSPYGRIGRWQYLGRVGLLLLATFVGGFAFHVITELSEARGTLWVGLPMSVFWTITTAKRLRDAGKSAQWAYLQVVPVVGLGLALYCLFARTRGDHSQPTAGVARVNPANEVAAAANLLTTVPEHHSQSSSPQANPTEAPAPLISLHSPSYAEQDEQLWAAALAELEQQRRRPGLWARAFSEAMGDEAKASAIYLALRVRQLKAEAEPG